MSKKVTKSQLEMLQQQRDHTRIELEHLEADLRTEVEHDDIDDSAQDLIERDKTYALIVTLKHKLDDIDHAIEQTQAGGYGICESCGKAIEPERLEIFPETTFCVDCKRESEPRIRSSMKD